MHKLYVVIYTDFGDSCDGFARVFGTYNTKEEAMKEMNADIKDWRKTNKNCPLTINKGENILYGDECNGCQWQVLELEVKDE